ncbi:MAG TPA: M14 family zinc carboxypeptidase [Bacteroidia bacterium]|nr:M14 family zinc carboxypeptidase [Bacteroidia bacterium]
MKRQLVLLMLLGTTIFSSAQDALYSRVKIWFDGKSSAELAKLGIDLTEGDYRRNVWFTSDFSDRELKKIEHAGFRTEILVNDVKKFYREQNKGTSNERFSSSTVTCGDLNPEYPVPVHFYLGSMGGFFTHSQLMNILDSMTLEFPNLITERQPIDTTSSIEGRPLYYVKISDNPSADEAEPEVLYSALHHAREPESISQLIYYMWYLLENYANDSTIRSLVDNTEMYFIPCINPDGYIHNETTDPFGGGMWRKNLRDNLDGEFGVDLNRNYGEQWGLDDVGSSPNTGDGTYRGVSAFSEPETQAMRNFTNSHEFRLALNYHTFGNYHIVPWGFGTNVFTPDSMLFDFYGHELTKYNHFLVGTANQTVNYTVNGSSDDWMYGDQQVRPKVFAMTPEVGEGNDGFWPASGRIIDLCKGSMYSNITLARLAGRYGVVRHEELRYVSSLSNTFPFSYQLLGLDSTGTITVSLIPLSSNILSVGSLVAFSGMSVLQTLNDSITYTLNPAIVPGDIVRFVVAVNNGLFVEGDTISRVYGTPVSIFTDDCSSLAGWNTGATDWDITTEDFVSASTSFTDSPFNTYQANNVNALTLSNGVSLSGAVDAVLSFDAKWSVETGYDYVQVLVSSDNGASWTALCGKYTVTGSASQAFGEPVFDGNQPQWVHEEMSLSDFLGQDILVRFQIVSDAFQELDGFYFDNLEIGVVTNTTGISLASGTRPVLSPAVPNPATGDAFVSFNMVSPGSEFVVYNSFGQKVFEKEISVISGKLQIPSATFANGMYSYFILLSDGSASEVMKLMVQK